MRKLTLLSPRVLVPTPSTKAGGVEKDPPVSQEQQTLPSEVLGLPLKV